MQVHVFVCVCVLVFVNARCFVTRNTLPAKQNPHQDSQQVLRASPYGQLPQQQQPQGH